MIKIPLKTPKEIAVMVEGGKKLSEIMAEVLAAAEPGLSTWEINLWVDKKLTEAGGGASFKKVPRYHWASCVGVNSEVVHSIPRKDKVIKQGDLLKIDMGLFWKGFNTDMSWTIEVQKSKVRGQRSEFLEAGERALEEAIEESWPGNRIGHISRAIEETVKKAGYQPVTVLTGHGIGRSLHEKPLIPGFLKGRTEDTPELRSGMTLAIEVIYAEGTGEVVLGADGWTILTKDGKMSGLFEKTIAITESKPLILTPL